jgi:hypothetical protein
MFFHNTNRIADLPNLALIEKRLKELGLYYYHFTEKSRPDERCDVGWLFAINDQAKITNTKHAVVHCESSELETQRSDDTRFKQGLQTQRAGDRLYLGLVSGDNYGWGVCSQYLIEELSRKTKCQVLSEADGTATNPKLDGKCFQALTTGDFFAMFEQARGTENYGYTFFENELTTHSVENAKIYDLVLAGSSWCRDRMQ